MAEYTGKDQSYMEQMFEYSVRYIELGSMVFDLYPFVPFLSPLQRHKLHEKLTFHVKQHQTEPMRRARSTINLFKLLKMLGLISDSNTTVKDI